MSRRCYGDIEHTFWFGDQNSDAASQFGGERDINFIPYYYHDMEDFNLKHLDKLINKANKMFSSNIDKDSIDFIEKINNINVKLTKKQSKLLADIELGIKIYQCIKEKGTCEFEAEF